MTNKKQDLLTAKVTHSIIDAALTISAGEAAFPKILKLGIDLTGTDFGNIFMYDKDSQTLKLLITESGGNDAKLAYQEIPIDASIEGSSFRSGRITVVPNAKMEPRYHQVHENIRSLIVIPLRGDKNVIGVLTFESTKNVEYSHVHLDTLQVLASFLVIAFRKTELERQSTISESVYLDSKKPLVFVLMPFRDPFDKYYKSIIKPAIEEAGMLALRADEIFGPTEIVNDIWKAINKAEIVVAELTTRNPNVMYELGLSHAIGKHVIMLSQSIDDIPFDLRSLRCILYDTVEPEWAELLRRKIVKSIKAATTDEVREEALFIKNKNSTSTSA